MVVNGCYSCQTTQCDLITYKKKIRFHAKDSCQKSGYLVTYPSDAGSNVKSTITRWNYCQSTMFSLKCRILKLNTFSVKTSRFQKPYIADFSRFTCPRIALALRPLFDSHYTAALGIFWFPKCPSAFMGLPPSVIASLGSPAHIHVSNWSVYIRYLKPISRHYITPINIPFVIRNIRHSKTFMVV